MLKLTLKHKVAGLCALAALLPLIVISALTFYKQTTLKTGVIEDMQVLTKGETEKTARIVYKLCEMANRQTAERLDKKMSVARIQLRAIGGLTRSDEPATWKAINPSTGETVKIDLRKMMAGGTWLGMNESTAVESPVIDSLAKTLDCSCSLFQRMNQRGDMLAISTTVRTKDNRRAIGVAIMESPQAGEVNPVFAAVLKGDSYTGRALVAGEWQMAAFEPIWDSPSRKEVIGMIAIGYPMESVYRDTRQIVMSIPVGKTGYVGIIGGKGLQRGHYIISKNGERDGEYIWETRDAQGEPIIRRIVEKAQTTRNGSILYDRYAWMNIGETVPRMKTSALTYFAAWDWVILAGMYEDDYHGVLIKVESAVSRWLRMLALAGAIALIVVVAAATFLARSITAPVENLVNVAQLVAQGNLIEAREKMTAMGKSGKSPEEPPGGAPDDRADETTRLSAAIEKMISDLRSLVGLVQTSCVWLVSSATQMAAASREQESNVASFSAATTQAASSVQEISATSEELARAVQDVKDIATDTATLANSGRSGLEGMENVMNQLADATMTISSKLAVISKKANLISSVVTAISKVADQTNLLSLNASIEAEKAGEQGLGFSVVAREIRRLADQTAAATLDIEQTVTEMQTSVSAGVMEMDKFSQDVRHGVVTVGNISRDLAQIIEKVEDLTPRFEIVNDGMKAQSLGAHQISEAMVFLSEGARKETDSLKQFNEATRQLTDAVHTLQEIAARFKV